MVSCWSVLFCRYIKGAKPLDLVGSDHRLELQIAPGSFDLTHATVNGKPVSGPIALSATQQHGLLAAQVPVLGSYTLQLVDSSGHPLSGVSLRLPITYLYHYHPADLAIFYFDPGQILLTFPVQVQAARSQHQPVGDFVVRLLNNAKTQTLSGQSHGFGPFDLGSDTNLQSPPVPHLASVGGNTGQLSYTYPLPLAPGPPGMPTSLSLSYSSESTNERHSMASPSGDVGEGWSLSFGSITADVYTANDAGGAATWYSINNVAGVSDRLVPFAKDTTTFLTQHISPLKIQQVQSQFGQPCFTVWDANGTYYTFGCSQDSLQYYTKSDGTRVNYRWDLNSIIVANEGPHTGAVSMTLQYLQDSTTTNGQTSIHDSAVWQATVTTGTGVVANTIDFFYRGRTDQTESSVRRSSAYGSNYNCTPIPHHPAPNPPTILRCDDPVDASGGLPAPLVLSTYSLTIVQSYLGTEKDTLAYRYDFSYTDHPYWSCTDDYTQLTMNCADDHLLNTVKPTDYLKGVGTARPVLSLVYNTATTADDYFDTSQHPPSQPSQDLHESTYWNYLISYEDAATGEGASSISYALAYNNTHGTPAHGSEDRTDPLYCDKYSDCTGSYAYPDDRAWAVQVVTSITASGRDSSAITSAQTQYAYSLQVTEQSSCTPYPQTPPPPPQDKRCVGDEWMPAGSSDFLSYYQSEYHGMSDVYITSPAGDLTDDTYYSNADWGSLADDFNNYLSGALYEEKIYTGNASSGPLLRDTVNTYAGTISGENDSCNGNYSGLYTPCAVLQLISLTTYDEGGANAHPPTLEEDNTFDDYANVQGEKLGFGYNNLIKQVITSSNAPTLTKKWTYTTNDQNIGGWVYHDVNKVTQSEVDDNTGKIWSCQTTAYDEGVAGVSQQPPTPAQGLPTTVTTASDCSHQGQSAITTLSGYDANGHSVATVDGLATANASFYGTSGIANENGCTLSSAPAVFPTTWSKAYYTTCATYDRLTTQPTSHTNAFGQSSQTAYDANQQGLPTSSTDANSQVTQLAYSYDSHGNGTIQESQPGESLDYTTQSSTNANACPSSLPCYQIDTGTALYSPAVSRTFYDALGRAVETRTTGPGVYDTVSFTVYNDATHTVFTSVPFQVTEGSGWLDPNGATDYTGHTPGGTVSFYDALNRLLAVQDPLYGTGNDGISCSATLSGSYTACTNYSLNKDSGDPNITDPNVYATTTSIDPNNHVSESFTDVLGRTIYTQTDSGGGPNNGTLSPNQQQSIQYNVLNEPTQVQVDDLAPQNHQSITSVVTTAQYDSLGRLTQLVDPDRGTHTYSYDPDSHLLSDVSGSRTIGTNDDLLGRVGCVQDKAPVLDADGSCTNGSDPLVQNTYDTSKIGTQGSTDFPIGRLTKSVSTTYFPEGTSATTTQKYQHDVRGRLTNTQLVLTVPGSWNVSTALPTYAAALSYTDTNQPSTVITSSNPSGTGYTSTLVYDPTGALQGLGTTNNPTANLATLAYTVNALVGTLTLASSNGSNNAAQEQFSYDGNLRPIEATATWKAGSGNSGQIFDQSRSYDPANNVVSLSTTQATIPGQSQSGGSETENYCYDEQNRLVWAGNSGSQPGAGHGTCGSGTLGNTLNGASYSNSFVLTNLGQLWNAPVNGTGSSQQYLYCDSSHPHQLTGIYPTGTTCSNRSNASYTSSNDAWGNVTSRTYSGSTATLSYDQLDRMVEWQNSGANTHEWYLYDASGNRVLRRSTTSGTTTITSYPFGSEDHTYSGNGTLQGSLYYYSLGGRLVGEQTDSSSTVNLILTDALGSVLVSFSNTYNHAALLGNQDYGPYGSQNYQSGTVGTNKGFTGHYADATGLDYYNARYYDPVASVFLSADSVQGNLQGMNPYGYVMGNPETKSDPTGQHVVCGDTCGGGNGNGGGPPPPPSPPPPPTNTCTQDSCSVTVEGKTYSLNQLKTGITDRLTFLQLLYAQLANGYGNSEIAFVNYLITSGRLHPSAYWNSVDFQVIRDQLLAAYDFLHHQAGQSSLIDNWLAFFAHPNTNGWWVAHNDSINAGDQQARTEGLYAKESGVEQVFINETIHVLGDVQYVAQSPLSFLFDPRSSTTAMLTSIFYPQQYNDFATGTSLFTQGVTASVGVAVVGTIVGAIGGPVGLAVGAVAGITGGATFFQSLLTSP